MIGDGLGRLLTLVGVAPRFSRELLVRSAERWKTENVGKQAVSNSGSTSKTWRFAQSLVLPQESWPEGLKPRSGRPNKYPPA